MKSFSHNDVELILFKNGSFILTKKNTHDFCDDNAADRANFQISLYGGRELPLDEFVFDGEQKDGNILKLFYKNNKKGLYVTSELEFISGTNVISQKNTVKNTGEQKTVLTKFSSAFFDCIPYDGTKWYEKDLEIYICHNSWQSEGQWSTFSPAQLGLYPSTFHSWENERYTVSTLGSWSSDKFYPLVLVNDKDTGYISFMETEGSHSWSIDISAHGGYEEPSLSLSACSCSEFLGDWHYILKPGEEYTTERAFFGISEGGFEGAISHLNSFKRKDSAVKYGNSIPPIVFNDYMNCVWGNQDSKKITLLIEKAAEVGCEVFCIDDGWQTNKNGNGHGDWIPRDYNTLKELADKISKSGMIPGIWVELDACTDNAFGYNPGKNWVLKRYDNVIGGERAFYNFKSNDVIEYLTERIKNLYDMGFRFIKNDYNQSTGIGCTNNYDGDSPAEGLIQNVNAFYTFIDSLYDRFPDLIIENCGSGAMRNDNKMLRRSMLQSMSDQEIYLNNPSVMMGSMSLMPPEKIGIWAYPYPLPFGKNDDLLKSSEYVNHMSNGLETSFNMVTAMFGSMYLSGRIDMCDKYNLSLIKEATDIYKKIRKYIPLGVPVYPTGICRLNEKGYASFGLLAENVLLLGIWNINSEKEEIDIDLSKYLSNSEVKYFYSGKASDYCFKDKVLKLKLENNSAAFFTFLA